MKVERGRTSGKRAVAVVSTREPLAHVDVAVREFLRSIPNYYHLNACIIIEIII